VKSLWVNPPWWCVLALLVVGGGLCVLAIMGDCVVRTPGPTPNILAATTPASPASGELLVLTVSESTVGPVGAVQCWLSPDCEVNASTAGGNAGVQRQQADSAAVQAATPFHGSSGVASGATPRVSLPGVVGPSAGLATALALISAQTQTVVVPAGTVVAVTGTVDAAGVVGQVGGIEQKAVAAARAGASTMLVPTGQGPQASGTSVPVVEIGSVAQALAWLCAHGGHGPACRVR